MEGSNAGNLYDTLFPKMLNIKIMTIGINNWKLIDLFITAQMKEVSKNPEITVTIPVKLRVKTRENKGSTEAKYQ